MVPLGRLELPARGLGIGPMKNSIIRANRQLIKVFVIEKITTRLLLFIVVASIGIFTEIDLLWTPVWTRETYSTNCFCAKTWFRDTRRKNTVRQISESKTHRIVVSTSSLRSAKPAEQAKPSSRLPCLKAAVNRRLCLSRSVLAELQKNAEAHPC